MSNDDAHEHGALSPFQSHLAMGLHAFAQPLAILRAKLYTESIARMDAAELSQLATDSAGHVERLCTLFNYLQEIVLAENAEPALSSVSVHEVIEHVVDGVELWFQDAGLTLSLEVGEADVIVLADKSKLSQVISSLALLAHGKSKPGETVVLRCMREADYAEITVLNSAADVSSLSAEARLALALVETNIRRQAGSFSYSLQPFELRVCVPNVAITT